MSYRKTVYLCLSIALLFTSISLASEFKGKISVSKNDKDKIDYLTLSTSEGEYKIKGSGKGAKLAKEAEGENVLIKGKESTQKDKEGKESKWLNVSSYSIYVEGKVTVEKDEKGKKATGVSVGGKKLKFSGKGKELAKMEGKTVIAFGSKATVKSGKEKIEVFSVKSYKEVTDEKK